MRRTILLILALTLALAGEASASGTDVLRDCTDDGRLQRTYTQQELKNAIAKIPSDVDEYTDCRDVIKKAQLAVASGGGDTPTSNGGTGTPSATGTTDPATGGTSPSSTGSGTTGGGDDAASGGGTTDGGGTGGDDGATTGTTKEEPDPLETASEDERLAVAEATAQPPATLAGESSPGLPTPVWIVLGLAAAGLIAVAASDLRRRVHARRVA
jgi:hypothetical protein